MRDLHLNCIFIWVIDLNIRFLKTALRSDLKRECRNRQPPIDVPTTRSLHRTSVSVHNKGKTRLGAVGHLKCVELPCSRIPSPSQGLAQPMSIDP